MNDSPTPSTPAPQDVRPSVSTTRRFATVCVVALLVVGGAIVAANRDGIPETGAAPAAPSPSTAPTEAPAGTQPQRVPTVPANHTPSLPDPSDTVQGRENIFRALLAGQLDFFTFDQAKRLAQMTCDALDDGVTLDQAVAMAAVAAVRNDLTESQTREIGKVIGAGIPALCPDQAWQLGEVAVGVSYGNARQTVPGAVAGGSSSEVVVGPDVAGEAPVVPVDGLEVVVGTEVPGGLLVAVDGAVAGAREDDVVVAVVELLDAGANWVVLSWTN